VRAEEGERELKIKGKRCGVLLGWRSPYIEIGEHRGSVVEAVMGGNGWSNSLNAINGRG
jgi:hypothetical protein